MNAIAQIKNDAMELVELLELCDYVKALDINITSVIVWLVNGLYSSDDYQQQFDELKKVLISQDTKKAYYLIMDKLYVLWKAYASTLDKDEKWRNRYANDVERWREKHLNDRKDNDNISRYIRLDIPPISHNQSHIFDYCTLIAEDIIRLRERKIDSFLYSYMLDLKDRSLLNVKWGKERYAKQDALKKDEAMYEIIEDNKELKAEFYFVLKNKRWKKNPFEVVKPFSNSHNAITAKDIADILFTNGEPINYLEVYVILDSLEDHCKRGDSNA